MTNTMIHGKTLEAWQASHPLIRDLVALRETSWFNPAIAPAATALADVGLTAEDVAQASARLRRFAPYIAKVFPQTAAAGGLIESSIKPLPRMQRLLLEEAGLAAGGSLWLKLDNELPISGSIKARGGIHEVLKHAEDLALQAGLIRPGDDYSVLASDAARAFFGQYKIAVGSTGNLGLSIGIMSAQLGFQASVHMSADARQWKKDRLRASGVTVVEYESDYSAAVEQGRRQAESDPACYFVDDENSPHLFLGYAVAAERLKQQLDQAGVRVDVDHPLFVYLPCGVGGGPGGVAFGLKLIFGDAVHCVFAEPTHSPCMLLGVAPRRIWSRSRLSNKALKLPSPKPSSALRWMNSKNTGPQQRLAEDLQQQAFVAVGGGAVEQDAARLQLTHRLAVAGQALFQHLVIHVVGRGHQRNAGQLQRVHAGNDVVRQQRDVLDAFAVELHQEFLDLPGALAASSFSGMRIWPSGAVMARLVRPVYSPWMSK
jgi:D-serine dehydratase